METIRVRKLDHSNLHVDCDSGIAQELNEFFSFFVPGYRFMPAYKNKVWDGKIRLYSRATGELPAGLYHHLVQFARSRGYEMEDFKSDEYGYSERLMRSSAYLNYVKVGEKYLPTRILMVDMLNVGEKTQITMTNPSIGPLPDYVFTKAYLEKVNK